MPGPSHRPTSKGFAFMGLSVVTTTLPSAEDAQRMASGAVQARLAACVQVATAQVKGLQAVDVLLASHYSLQEEVRGLRAQVQELTETVAAWAPAAESVGSAPGRKGGKGKGKAGAARLSAAGDLGGALGEGEESELSELSDSMFTG